MFLFFWDLELGVTTLLLLFLLFDDMGVSRSRSRSSRRELFELGLLGRVLTEPPVFLICFFVASFSCLVICCKYRSNTKTFDKNSTFNFCVKNCRVYSLTIFLLSFRFLYCFWLFSPALVECGPTGFPIFHASNAHNAVHLAVQL
jgi:hypothetical protein